MIGVEYYCGAVFGWCYLRAFDEWVYRLLYWPVKGIKQMLPQQYKIKRLRFWSGLMSRARGLHFDYQLSSGRWY